MSKKDNLTDQDPHFDLAESRFRVLVEHAPEAILILDYDNKKYIEANPNAMKLFGYTKDELTNIHLGELSPEEQPVGNNSASFSAKMIAKAIEGDPVVFEWVIKRKDGQTVPCEVRVVRLPAKGRTLVRSSIIDISESKRSKIKLERSERQLRSFIDDTPFPVAMLDKDLNYIRISKEWERVYNNDSGEDLIGKNHFEMNPHFPLRWKIAYHKALKGE